MIEYASARPGAGTFPAEAKLSDSLRDHGPSQNMLKDDSIWLTSVLTAAPES